MCYNVRNGEGSDDSPIARTTTVETHFYVLAFASGVAPRKFATEERSRVSPEASRSNAGGLQKHERRAVRGNADEVSGAPSNCGITSPIGKRHYERANSQPLAMTILSRLVRSSFALDLPVTAEGEKYFRSKRTFC
ncbi:hypothetical protein BIW11_03300 [Tropilaelaps mercedesae]|uniref:Uncharacterized protein n=1 Tax=Tropilaelaps mercedesae TaxID=418985 RepID=A0A1V9XPA0_9ACAR|nr:hypothetical protein BIW11_03300 [Tropilaelaps mercedesae]